MEAKFSWSFLPGALGFLACCLIMLGSPAGVAAAPASDASASNQAVSSAVISAGIGVETRARFRRCRDVIYRLSNGTVYTRTRGLKAKSASCRKPARSPGHSSRRLKV